MPAPVNRHRTRDMAVLLTFLAFEIAWLVWVHSHDKLIDYYAYDVASTAVSQGSTPYRLDQETAQALAVQRGIGPAHVIPPYLYSPFLTALLQPLQWLPAPRAALIWSACSLLALTLSGFGLSQLHRRRWIDPAVFGGLMLFVPVLTTFYAGQVNHVLLLCMVVATCAIERNRNRLTGAALAAGILLKTIPICLAGVLLLQRRWQALAWLAAFGIAAVALTLPWVGLDLYLDYLSQAWRLAGAGTAPMVPANQSLGASTVRVLGADRGATWGLGGSGAVILVTLFVLACTSKRPHALLPGIGLVIAGVAVAAPLSWIHHQVLLAVPMVIVLRACRETPWQWAARCVVGTAIVMLDLVALAWRQLAPWPVLQSAGTGSMILLWLMLVALTWHSALRITASADA